MATVSNRCRYALRAMLELAKREGTGHVSIAKIAENQRIPVRFLETILRQLKQAGFASSQRGKDGGYALAEKAANTSLGEVMRLFEDGDDGAKSAAADPDSADCLFAEVWCEAEKARNKVHDAISFQDLVEREKARRGQFVKDYSI